MKKQKVIILASILTVALVAAYFLYPKPNSQSTPEQESSRIKDRVIDSYKDSGTSPGSDQPASKPQTDETAGDNKSDVSVMITASEVYADRLSVRAIVQTVTSSGTCTLNLTKDGSTKTYTSDVQPLPSSTACKGFDIPKSDLSPGTWTVEVVFENETYNAKTSKEVVIT